MSLQVQPLTDADFDVLISHADNGLLGDDTVGPPSPISWPVSTREEAQLRAQCHFSWQRKRLHGDPSLRYVKVINVDPNVSKSDDSKADGEARNEIVAVARWHYYPTGYDYEREKQWEMAPENILVTASTNDDRDMASSLAKAYPPSNFNRPMHNYILTKRDSFRSQWIPTDGPAWVLMHLVTRPSQRRRGAAEMLVRWGQEQAAQTGADAYLEAGVAGKPLYERCGFVAVGETRMFDLREYKGVVDEFEIVNMRWSSAAKRKPQRD